MDIKQLLTIANSESNDRDLEIIDKEKNIYDQRQENMGFLIGEKAMLQVLSNNIERKQLYLEELKRGNRIDEMKGLEDQSRILQSKIDKLCADCQLLKNQKQGVQDAMGNIIRQLQEEQDSKKMFEIATIHHNYHSSKKELERVKEEKQLILEKLVFEKDEQPTFIGLERKIEKMKLKIKKADLDLKAADRESIEAAALLANNDRVKAELIEENIAVNKKIKDAFGSEYPEDTNLLERFKNIKERVKDLRRDLNSAAFAKNEFLLGILEGSKESGRCFLCDNDFSPDCYDHRKDFFDKTLRQPTDEERRSINELKEFEAEYEVLKKFRPDIQKLDQNAQRIADIDRDTEKLFSDAGRKIQKINQAKEVHNKLVDEELELKEMQLLISREDDLERIIAGIDVSVFAGEDEVMLGHIFEKGLMRPENLATMLSDKQKSICVIDHNMTILNDQLQDLNKQKREVGTRIQTIKDERKNEKSIDEIQHDIEINTLEYENKREALLQKEKSLNEEMEEKEKQMKSEKAVLSRLNYLLPDLEKRHTNLMKLNTTNCDETIMMTNYRKFKEVGNYLEKTRDEMEVKRIEQDKLKTEIKLVEDKILFQSTEEEIRKKENEVLIQTQELKMIAGQVEKEKQMHAEFIKVTANVSNLEGKDESHKKSAQEYYDKIYRNRDKEMQYFERLTHYEYYRMLVEDLDLYMQSLEEALVKYHREKIELINRNIAELWKMTYQNGDIKRIEIKAEQIVDPTMENKGNFNYRVVFYNKE